MTTSLSNTYEKVKPSIVAFTKKYMIATNSNKLTEAQISFPPVLGTGFIINENGIIVTNDHIAEQLKKNINLPFTPKNECIHSATMFKITNKGLAQIPLDILEIYQRKSFKTDKIYFEPEKPDIAFVLVKVKGLPALELDTKAQQEGIEVASAGYPIGIDAPVAQGWLQQITPTLQKGIISVVFPFQQAFPHAYAINIMVQSGASGSPVFLPENGKVIGIINNSLNEYIISDNNNFYNIPAHISYVIPSYHIYNFYKDVKAEGGFELPNDTQTLDDLFANKKQKLVLPHESSCKITKIDL